jgi:hypothetical protein
MFRYEDDDDYYYERESRIYNRGCTCNSLSEEPCSYCQGDYPCQDGCGYSAGNCQCPPTWDDLPDDEQRRRINEAFDYLCSTGNVPYGVQTGDDATWDEYDPAIELAQEWYDNERVG